MALSRYWQVTQAAATKTGIKERQNGRPEIQEKSFYAVAKGKNLILLFCFAYSVSTIKGAAESGLYNLDYGRFSNIV